MISTSRAFLLATCSAVILQTPAFAQSAADDSEIVVTANKRQENINKAGLTITAIGAEALAERKITSLEDVALIVPGLAYTPSTTNTPIRAARRRLQRKLAGRLSRGHGLYRPGPAGLPGPRVALGLRP